jgi:hypothetical protein
VLIPRIGSDLECVGVGQRHRPGRHDAQPEGLGGGDGRLPQPGDVLGELGQAVPGTAVRLDYRALHLPAEPVSGQLPHEPVSLPCQPPRGQVDDMELLLHSGCHEPRMDG